MSTLSLTDLQTKALQVIRNELSYDAAIPGHQLDTFDWSTRQVKTYGGNEYDAAITFMLVQLGTLTQPLKGEGKVFYDIMSQKLKRIAPKSIDDGELLYHFLKSQSVTDELVTSSIAKAASRERPGTPGEDVESRLLCLKGLWDKGLINQDQYDLKREKIIREI